MDNDLDNLALVLKLTHPIERGNCIQSNLPDSRCCLRRWPALPVRWDSGWGARVHCLSAILYITCYRYMLHVTCYMLPGTCYMFPGTCYMLQVTCYKLHVACYMLYVTWYMLHVTSYQPQTRVVWILFWIWKDPALHEWDLTKMLNPHPHGRFLPVCKSHLCKFTGL